jgi:hypothetical protein
VAAGEEEMVARPNETMSTLATRTRPGTPRDAKGRQARKSLTPGYSRTSTQQGCFVIGETTLLVIGQLPPPGAPAHFGYPQRWPAHHLRALAEMVQVILDPQQVRMKCHARV